MGRFLHAKCNESIVCNLHNAESFHGNLLTQSIKGVLRYSHYSVTPVGGKSGFGFLSGRLWALGYEDGRNQTQILGQFAGHNAFQCLHSGLGVL